MTGAGGRCCVAVVLRFRRINRVIAESLSQLLRAVERSGRRKFWDCYLHLAVLVGDATPADPS